MDNWNLGFLAVSTAIGLMLWYVDRTTTRHVYESDEGDIVVARTPVEAAKVLNITDPTPLRRLDDHELLTIHDSETGESETATASRWAALYRSGDVIAEASL